MHVTRPPDFEALVTAHSSEIFAYLWRWLHDTADAEDCLQETFLRAYRAYPRLDAGAQHRAWLYKIATNVAHTHGGRRARAAARTVDLDLDSLPAPASPLEGVQRRQLLRAVRRMVEALPPQQRAALILRQYQGLSYPAVARALNCTEAAARANVYQALQKLRAEFADWEPEEA